MVGREEFTLLIGGPAGAGVFRSGIVAAKTLFRHGYYVHGDNEYPSIIRGGHQWMIVKASAQPVHAHGDEVDAVLALDRETLRRHKWRARELVVADEGVAGGEEGVLAAPLMRAVREEGAPSVAVNMAGLGFILGVYRGDIGRLKDSIRRVFARKRGVAEVNARVAERGYRYGLEVDAGVEPLRIAAPLEGKVVIDGNSAVALGALAGGLGFFAAYPMTPASPILHLLAELQRDYGILVLQPESELAAINMVTGAAYAGARAMTATSGGGFSLMVEALGQAAMTETPVVIVEAMRAGPSTGMPTYTSQADLRFVLHASQGEFPRFVLAPGDPYEAFMAGFDALNLAWRYQVPAIILTDKYLAEGYWTVDEPPALEPEEGKVIRGVYEGPEPYLRYRITPDGVSPMAIPGTRNALVNANSSEHGEDGYGSTDPEVVRAMQDKRFRKLESMSREANEKGVKTYGEGGLVVVTWGSTKNAVLEAVRDMYGVRVVQVLWLAPFPAERLADELEGASRILVVEHNKTGQLASLIREHLLVAPDGFLGKYDGRPFTPEEVEEWITGFQEG